MERTLDNSLDRLRSMRFDRASAIERSALPSYMVIAAMVGFIILCVAFTDFTWDGALLGPPALSLLAIAAVGAALRGVGLKRIGSGMEALALSSAISLAAALCATLLAATNLPLADAKLADLDRKLFFGFERGPLVEWLMRREVLFDAIRSIYHTLVVQPSVLIAVLFGLGMTSRGWRLILASSLTAVLGLAIFPFFPAVGSPPYFLDFMDTFNGSRDGTLRVLGELALTGIVTFPSFHAAGAVLLGWGFARVPKIGPMFVVLNGLMFASALVAGHYLVDLVAGGIIAALGIAVSKAIIGRIERHTLTEIPPSGHVEAELIR